MTRLTYYFDPLCPWSWLTSLWVREVRKYRDVEITWKFFSLAEVNQQTDPVRYGPLRIAALARREHGNDGADRAYLALGRLYHERRDRPANLEELAQKAQEPLREVGLDPSLAPRAVQDESTLEDVRRDHQEAVQRFKAFGVPWLVLGDEEFGYFGPVVNTFHSGETSAELWDRYVWLASCSYLFELKRERQPLPELQGLSDAFIAQDSAAG